MQRTVENNLKKNSEKFVKVTNIFDHKSLNIAYKF